MWRLKMAIWLLEALTMRQQESMAELNIDDDVALALRLLRKASATADKRR